MTYESEGEVFPLLVHSSGGCSSQDWAKPEPRARSFILVSHMGAGALPLVPQAISCEAVLDVEQPGPA